MKFSEDTINVLKNFSTINSNLFFKAGTTLSTIVEESHIFAQAELSETIPSDFAIYDLHKLLATLSLFELPDIVVGDKALTISKDKEAVTFVFADPSTIVYPKKTKIELPEPKIKFALSEDQLNKILKSAGALQLPDLSIIGDATGVTLKAHDKKNSSSNCYTIKADDKSTDEFDIRFKVSNLRFIPGNYSVDISIRNNIAVGYFVNEAKKVKYWVSSESDSKF